MPAVTEATSCWLWSATGHDEVRQRVQQRAEQAARAALGDHDVDVRQDLRLRQVGQARTLSGSRRAVSSTCVRSGGQDDRADDRRDRPREQPEQLRSCCTPGRRPA